MDHVVVLEVQDLQDQLGKLDQQVIQVDKARMELRAVQAPREKRVNVGQQGVKDSRVRLEVLELQVHQDPVDAQVKKGRPANLERMVI